VHGVQQSVLVSVLHRSSHTEVSHAGRTEADKFEEEEEEDVYVHEL
jgi:hypothetical protein